MGYSIQVGPTQAIIVKVMVALGQIQLSFVTVIVVLGPVIIDTHPV
jgi:hypothetical protein